ncbi:MAG: dehydratase [Actinomycetia bacterium]|nr:dehydratase [Actinomycetes bacterium]
MREVATELDRTPAQVALNWVLHRKGITSPLVGARTVEQLDDTLGAVGWQLEPEMVERLTSVSRIHFGYPQEFQVWMASVGM